MEEVYIPPLLRNLSFIYTHLRETDEPSLHTHLREIRDKEAENAELQIYREGEEYEVGRCAHVTGQLWNGLLHVPMLQVQVVGEQRHPQARPHSTGVQHERAVTPARSLLLGSWRRLAEKNCF